jgi:hypothetical protein
MVLVRRRGQSRRGASKWVCEARWWGRKPGGEAWPRLLGASALFASTARVDRILWEVSYSREGVAKLLDEDTRARRVEVAKFFEQLGGHLEAMYFSIEDGSAYLIAALPDGVSASGPQVASLLVGAMQVKSVVLITPEEMALTGAGTSPVDMVCRPT